MDGFEQTNVRLPRGIKAWLKAQARQNRRSFSAEVAVRLEASRREQERKEKRSKKN